MSAIHGVHAGVDFFRLPSLRSCYGNDPGPSFGFDQVRAPRPCHKKHPAAIRSPRIATITSMALLGRDVPLDSSPGPTAFWSAPHCISGSILQLTHIFMIFNIFNILWCIFVACSLLLAITSSFLTNHPSSMADLY